MPKYFCVLFSLSLSRHTECIPNIKHAKGSLTDRVVPSVLVVRVGLVVVDLVEEEVVGALRVERARLLDVQATPPVEDDGTQAQLRKHRLCT